MRRLIAVAAVAMAVSAVPAAPALAYDRQCGGIVDTECNGTVCPMDCFARECFLWIDVQHNPMTAQCIRAIVAS